MLLFQFYFIRFCDNHVCKLIKYTQLDIDERSTINCNNLSVTIVYYILYIYIIHRRAQTLFSGYAIRNIRPLTNKFSNLPLMYLHFFLTHIRFKSQSKFLHIYYLASLLPLESKITHIFTVEY
jgi:hypothetical protein